MAKTYWASFRLENDADYARRYDGLVEAIRLMSGDKWWVETSAFLVFRSALSIDDIASKIRNIIRTQADVVLLGMTDYKSARLIGASVDDDIFDLMPFTKKV